MQTIEGPEEFAARFGAPPETIERLRTYERLLRQWQKAVNLVAAATHDAVWHRHFADSAQLVRLAPPEARSWIDLGSGAGFPGMVAAIMLAGVRGVSASPRPSPTSPQTPSAPGRVGGERYGNPPPARGQPVPVASRERQSAPIRFLFVESDARKCAFLREVVRQTGLAQAGIAADVLSKRAESVRRSVNEALPRVLSARALAPLDRLLELAAPLSPPGTTLLFLKGREVGKELQMAETRWQFHVALVPSVTDTHGRVAVITNLERKAKD
ncbi:MAG: 16S rRNA (guanine(527)-N(7))-methyltransferase RsmG [Hyphomicrobiaceae bacterium]|nr:16S rRNA (guanine(527)-N(7))-methyltransferase RsmG [Hyphomicrobiaceae bacterium]